MDAVNDVKTTVTAISMLILISFITNMRFYSVGVMKQHVWVSFCR